MKEQRFSGVGKHVMSCHAKPAKKPTIRPHWTRDGTIPLSSVQSLYVVELKLSLRTHLAHQMHGDACTTPKEVYCQPSPSALLRVANSQLSSFLGSKLN